MNQAGSRSRIVRGLTLALVMLAPAAPRAVPQNPPAPTAAAAVPIDVIALDRSGKFAEDLAPASFAVTVDGKPRNVLWVRYVSRGPGSMGDATQRQLRGNAASTFAAEPARNVLVVVDESSLQRGSERTVLLAATALVDRLGLDDRIGVLRVPATRDSSVTLTTVRPVVREALRQVTGQAAAAGASEAATPQPQQQAADPNRIAGDPGQAAGVERERLPTEAVLPARAGADNPGANADLLGSLKGVLAALESSPGRKVILVFSGGVMPADTMAVDEVAMAASAAHAVIYAFGIPETHDDPSAAPDLRALERLARASGGSYVTVGKNPDRTVAQVMPELSACYVLGIEGAPTDADGRRHALRVDAPRLALTVRAPAWLVAKSDLADLLPAPAGGAMTTRPAVSSSPGSAAAGPAAPAPRTAVPFARDPEVQRLLSRASDYTAGYQREYSLLVAEENYVQTSRTERRQLRSDLLLVRTPEADGWVSFRDVYEVNGTAVRDRDDRLKRLFLDPSAEAQAQLKAIKEESARYNIGQVERNINVPLFPLKFLEAANLLRFEYKAAGHQEVGGVDATRVAFVEWARPTLVRYNQEKDLPVSGWFLVDPVSGAIVGTRMEMASDLDRVVFEFEVRYRRDESLGLWVPAEMRETYSTLRVGTTERTVSLEGRATYSNFRRFQVKIEEQIKIPK